jgi:hypothetical protein
MQKMFELPPTPKCQVVYVKDDVRYSATIPTPRDNTALQAAMLERHVGFSQIQAVNPIQPPPDYVYHPSPAQSQIHRLGLPTH